MLEQNRACSKKLWTNQSYRINCLKSFVLHNEKMQHDVEYAARYRRKSKSVTGTILIGESPIRFDSAYELLFIWYCKDKMTIRRCHFAIAYGNHFYHPDFMIIDQCGNRTLVEIKGYYRNSVVEKQVAAEQYISQTGVAEAYILYDTKRLLADGILNGVGGAYMWRQIRNIYDEAIITFTDPKHKRIAEIGISRYTKEAKNQEY
jgi:hypothetical protein